MSGNRVTIFPGHRDGELSGHYADGDLALLLEARSRDLLEAEGAVRLAQATLDQLVASARHDQGALVASALKSLNDRRPA